MRAHTAALVLAIGFAAPALADRYDHEIANAATRPTLSEAVAVPEVFESQAQFEETAGALLGVSRALCRRQHGSSAMRTVIIRACTAGTFKASVEQLPDTPARVALLAYWADELDEG